MSRFQFQQTLRRLFCSSWRSRRRSRRPAQQLSRDVALLETRVLLSGTTGVDVPRGESFTYNTAGTLTPAANGDPLQIATSYLRSNYAALGLTAGDVDNLTVTSQHTEDGNTYIYLRQMYQNLQVGTADMSVTLLSDGRILAIGSQFVSGLATHVATASAALTAADAIGQAASYLGIAMAGGPQLLSNITGPTTSLTYAGADLSQNDIKTQLMYYPGDDGQIHLTWNLNVNLLDNSDWVDLFVDARTGAMIGDVSWASHDDFSGSGTGTGTASAGSSSTSSFTGPSSSLASLSGLGSYNVYGLPSKAPDDGVRAVVDNPASPTYSPYGWHDTNGVAGAEYTDTRGNNVDAHLDLTDNDSDTGLRADGGAGLNFDFPLDLLGEPWTYQSAAIVQAFYTANMAHDLFARYGFTEAAGNFQIKNYSNTGAGNDQVKLDVQDGGGYNNANFATPVDGLAPRMQMYLFLNTSPYRDGAIDNTVVLHEYGHGVTNRLTGGASNSNALDALQSGGMGEGWSDFFALMMTQKASYSKDLGYGMGTYLYGEDIHGPGVRDYPYSYNMAIDPLTLADFPSNPEVHAGGTIWSSALWDLNWLLIDKYGFDADMANGTSGNNLTMKLVMDALKIQPANPTFLDGRDAILAADLALTGGANQTDIWAAFARRGMGLSASDGGSANSTNVIAAYDVPNPVGTVSLDKSIYYAGDVVTITVNDGNVAGSTVNVTLTTNTGDLETVTLSQVDFGVYQGTISAVSSAIAKNNGKLNVQTGADIFVTYTDVSSTLTLPAVPATVYDTAAVRTNIFSVDFTDNAGKGSLEGFTLNNTPTSAGYQGGLWHISTGRRFDSGHSSTHSMYYGYNEKVNGGGKIQTASPTMGELTSPVLFIPAKATFSFNYLMERETGRVGYDKNAVMISVNNGAWQPLVENLDNTNGLFVTQTVDLGAYANRSVRFKFVFDTVDNQNNNYEGWYVDDVQVSTAVDLDDQISEASPMTFGVPILGAINNASTSDASDVDMYAISVVAGQAYGFDLDNMGAGTLDGVLRLFDASGKQLKVSNNNPAPGETLGTEPFLSYTFAESGTYYVGVSGSPNTGYNAASGGGDVAGSGGEYKLETLLLAAPVIKNVTSVVNYTELGAAVRFALNSTVTDADSTDFDGGLLQVKIAQNRESADVLSILTVGTGINKVTLNGSQVLVGGVLVGTFTGGTKNVALQVTLNANATGARTQALLRAIGYSNTSSSPGTGLRQLQVTLSDGDGTTSSPVVSTVNVTAVNDAPVLGSIGGILDYSKGFAPVMVVPTATVKDVDSSNLAGGRLTLRVTQGTKPGDLFSISAQGTGAGQISLDGTKVLFGGVNIGTVSGGTGSSALLVKFNINATAAAVQALLRRIEFGTTSLPNGWRTVQITLSDGDGAISAAVTKSIKVT
ncbi:M36 family metallopeptidase [Planctomicrobium piriforme]|uniref:Zn-dependent metalloprotease n=1 Tax=Planctomicrobium piriforme TaxID=1576369 RepID=A0A1I3LQB1_9PLAN|nr:M36 family metallopeptidase [Planctomicrobium piriforme]SFI86695.1 Zn-dependent metalloprotease [Planctomicrobium piriforme]